MGTGAPEPFENRWCDVTTPEQDAQQRNAEKRDREQQGAEADQDEVARRSRQTGGDAPAAGSVEERESVAKDEPGPFEEHGAGEPAEQPDR